MKKLFTEEDINIYIETLGETTHWRELDQQRDPNKAYNLFYNR